MPGRKLFYWGISGALLVIVIVLFFIFHRHKESIPTDPYNRTIWEWQQRSFTPISTNTAENRKLVERFPIDFQVSLTKDQEEKLLDTVAQVLTIYRTGDWNLFQQFAQARKGNADWNKLHTSWTTDYGSPSKGVWSGLDVSDAHIKVFQRMLEFSMDQASLQEEEREMLAFSDNKSAGILWIHGNVDYPLGQGPYLYALVYFVAKHQESHPGWPQGWPVAIWFRWLPSVQNWAPERWGALYAAWRSPNTNLDL